MSNKGKFERVTLRLTGNQKLVLDEMVEVLDTTYSLLIRTIVGSWLEEHEDQIYKLIDKKRQENANHKCFKEEAPQYQPQGYRYEGIKKEGL